MSYQPLSIESEIGPMKPRQDLSAMAEKLLSAWRGLKRDWRLFVVVLLLSVQLGLHWHKVAGRSSSSPSSSLPTTEMVCNRMKSMVSNQTTSESDACEQVVDVLISKFGVLNVAALEDVLSPQARALEWILSDDGRGHEFVDDETLHFRILQRYVLAVFYYAATRNGEQFAGRLPSSGECSWPLGTCENDKIVGLDLSFNNLPGSIPTEVGGLTSLEGLSLSDNNLSGPIPAEVGRLTSLIFLDLSLNILSGTIPTEVGGLTGLQCLYLFNNALSGPIATEVGRLTSLEELVLLNNTLSGPIPTEVGKMTSLQRMYLNKNNLSGSIPTEVGGLTSLEELYLGDNTLSGPIPTEVGEMSRLKLLDLHDNNLSGPIPTEMGGLSLTGLNLNDNKLSGPIPTEVGRLTSLYTLSLENNHLSGVVQSSVCSSLEYHGRFVTYDCADVVCCCGDEVCQPVGSCRSTSNDNHTRSSCDSTGGPS